jgi:hypothetical protein
MDSCCRSLERISEGEVKKRRVEMPKITKLFSLALVCFFALMVLLPVAALSEEDVQLINGNDWTQSTLPEKKSYLIGAGNLMVVEYLYQEGSGQIPSHDQTMIQRFYKAMEDLTLDDLIDEIDGWYKKNPEKMKEFVLVVIWKEIVEAKFPPKKKLEQ